MKKRGNTTLEAIKKENSVSRPMLSLEQSRAILNQQGIEYSDDEIIIIRDYMYRVAEITIKHYERIRDNDLTIVPKIQTDQDEAESIPIHPGKYRRAG
jgi:hypothetical protein